MAFPDRHWQLDALLQSEDFVTCRITVSGTYGERPSIPVEGALLISTPPSGKAYQVQQIHIFRVVAGQIVEHWASRDDLGLLLQLGVIEPLP